MLNELLDGGHAHPDHLDGRRRVLVPAQVRDGPGDVPQERDWNVRRVGQVEERLGDAALDDEVSHGWTIAGDVAQGPHGLSKNEQRISKP